MRSSLLPFSLFLLAAACLLAGCRSTAAPSPKSEAVAVRTLPYETQRRVDALFLEAVRQREKGSYDAESELLAEALRVDPDMPEALYEMAVLQLAFARSSDTLRIQEAEDMLGRAVALDSGNKFYKETLGRLYAGKGDYGKSLEIYEDLARQEPSVAYLSMLVSLYEAKEDFQGAIRTLDRLEQLEGKDESYSIEKFKIYTQQGDDERAYAAIEDLCAEYPADLRYRVLLGDLYQQNGHAEMALAIYRDVLTVEPDNSFAQLSLLAYYKNSGEDSLYSAMVEEVVLNPDTESSTRVEVMRNFVSDTFRNQGDTAKVLRLFRQALRQPQSDRFMAELFAAYMGMIEMPADSLEPLMRQILDVEPDYSRARLQLLQILLSHDEMEESARICREGQLYDPSQIVFFYYEGICLYRLGRERDALEALQRGAANIGPEAEFDYASDLYATMGDLLHDQGDKQAAYAAYDSALTYKSDNYMCMNNYAYFLSLDGNSLDRAEAMSRKTVEAYPANATYLDTYAWILFVKQQYTQARIYIDETLKNAEETAENATLYEHAGDIYYKCGERAAALAYWKTALRLTDDADRAAVLRKKIRLKRWVP